MQVNTRDGFVVIAANTAEDIEETSSPNMTPAASRLFACIHFGNGVIPINPTLAFPLFKFERFPHVN
jgi:hypothetical protein